MERWRMNHNGFMERLTGSALVAHYEAGAKAGLLKSEIVRTAGYTKTLPDGKERIQFGEFSEALLAAKGVILGEKGSSRPGRGLSYETAVLLKGQAVIGQGYLAQIGATPHSRLAIEVRKGTIVLKPVPDPAPVQQCGLTPPPAAE
jgi:hypothetical protein